MQGYPRSAFLLSQAPTNVDLIAGFQAVFYDADDQRKLYRVSMDHTAFFPLQVEPRTAAQLATTPSAQDITCRRGFGFHLDTDPSQRYVINTAATGYALINGGASTATVTGVPSAEAADRPLTAADNTKSLTCAAARIFTVPAGLGSGFGVAAKGPVTFTAGSGVTVSDLRTTAAVTANAWCTLMQTNTAGSTYDVVGSK